MRASGCADCGKMKLEASLPCKDHHTDDGMRNDPGGLSLLLLSTNSTVARPAALFCTLVCSWLDIRGPLVGISRPLVGIGRSLVGIGRALPRCDESQENHPCGAAVCHGDKQSRGRCGGREQIATDWRSRARAHVSSRFDMIEGCADCGRMKLEATLGMKTSKNPPPVRVC